MKGLFYGFAVVIAVVLIILGVLASRKTEQTETNNKGEFNAEQLQDAAEKQPAE